MKFSQKLLNSILVLYLQIMASKHFTVLFYIVSKNIFMSKDTYIRNYTFTKAKVDCKVYALKIPPTVDWEYFGVK